MDYIEILIFLIFIYRAFGLVVYEMIKLKTFFGGIFMIAANKILNFKNEDLDLNGIKPIFQNILRKYKHFQKNKLKINLN